MKEKEKEIYTIHQILSSLEISDETRREIVGSLLDNRPGGYSTIRPGMMRKAFDEGAAQRSVEADRADCLDPDMNRPYRLLQETLEGHGASDAALLPLIGLVALLIRRGDDAVLELEPYTGHEMAEAAVSQLRKDTGDRENLCTLRLRQGEQGHLLGIWYPGSGILAAAAGITEKAVAAADLPWLTWRGTRAGWSDPMPHLSADEAARLIFMLERLYPVARFPGMGAFMQQYGSCLTASARQRFASRIQLRMDPDTVAWLGRAAAETLTVPGVPVPEIFLPHLPVMRIDREHPARGRLCNTIQITLRDGEKSQLLVLPPLHRDILDDPKAVLDRVTLAKGEGGTVEMTVGLTYDGEILERKRAYRWNTLVDLSAAPAVLQHFHMQGVSDDQWNGRCLLVTDAVCPSRLDLEPIGSIPIAEFGPIEQCIQPDGHADVKRHLLHSVSGAWAVYRTGRQTRYVTLLDNGGMPVVHLLTEAPRCSWETRRYEGRGLLAIDPGTTTAHMAAVLDDAQGMQAPMLTVEFKAEEMAQPIGPMSDQTFTALCALCGQTDFMGPLHPTILEHFRTGDRPAELESPGIGTRLVHLTAESLVEIGEGSRPPEDLSINMKAAAGSGKAESQRATRAYTMALASFLQLGYLWMLSHGQDKIQVLIAYPKGVKSTELYDKAVQIVRRSLPQGVELDHKLLAESAAAGTYIRVIQPDSLPIHAGSDLMVIDIGGTTTDIDVSRGGTPVRSGSFAYAANLFQLSALLALLRRPHEGARGRWNYGSGMDILRSIFTDSVEMRRLGNKLSASASEAMARGKTDTRRQICSEIDRKRLEQLFRGGSWMIDPVDSLTQHWLQLWSLPIFALIADNLGGMEGGAVYSAMVGAGSIYLDGLLRSDSGFRSRVERWIVERSGVRAHKLVFTGSHQKPEVAKGMLMAELRGLDTDRQAFSAEPAAPIYPHMVTREIYSDFVSRLTADALVAPEAEPDDSFGLRSVYDLLVYTPDTLDGFDDFDSIVSDVAQRFPDVLLSEGPDLLLYMVAFDVAVRNLLNLQLRA